MKRRLIKKWNKVYSHSVVKKTDYAVNCYKKLKQRFPYKARTISGYTIVDWDKVEKYLHV